MQIDIIIKKSKNDMQKHIKWVLYLILYLKAYKMDELATFVKNRRKQLSLTQEEFADRSGVALTVIRKIEQGKDNLSLSKVNRVLLMFGHTLGPLKIQK
ncbi:helix-turn-helix domain-containing protein [Niabella hibiscisoli]|uniref:helix-turn-helix domain-containing protein n=1 Tax=Niabella hibiscisoli TaxID=1825928 RepID=UPI001F0DC75F|nr:helix-turn-helix domain-containing protein [Niabella hibiscisoli]MCH5719209.1 helix-turn-helix domain-containing protein [Niabella hibiscisoli]